MVQIEKKKIVPLEVRRKKKHKKIALLFYFFNCHFQNFILFFCFRPTDCMKRACEKSAIQGINRPWPKDCVLIQSEMKQLWGGGLA